MLLHSFAKRFRIKIVVSAIFLLLILCCKANLLFADTTIDERVGKIKAASLYYVAQFTTWPPQFFSETTSSIKFCIFGEDPLNAVIKETVDSKLIHGRRIDIAFEPNNEAQTLCAVAFFSKDYEISKLLSLPKSCLFVGTTSDFINYRGMIALVEQDNKLRIKINLEQIKSANLAVSSDLLSIAEVAQ